MTDHRDEPEEDSIIVDCDLAEPPEQVWRALTEPALLAAWLMPNDIRPKVGHRFSFQAEPDAGGTIACEVLDAEPNRLLRYSWRGSETERDAADRVLDTTVTFVLTGTAWGGTHLRIIHSGFTPAMQGAITMLAGTRRALSSLLASPVRDLQAGRRQPPAGRIVIQSGPRLAA
jgi:uncharacterized protein YndB with AHSA1/START domain